ncbi:bh protein [Niallia taxi]|uniref:bh protein n=1 Tax=Niallia taxi TaxID=2499688 RepID=UPI00119F5D60|nr:bh protein [Niallia taxi]MCT2343461.1 bh protein [Niallia taxi]MDE5053166.1 bh protein [Niallia taxi]MED3963506.1 bh protein [Niallia taxi]WOD61449.1 bh protein [Niallia taxi]
MEITEFDVSLYCSRCQDETLHYVHYLNNKISSTECTNCHRKIDMHLNPKRELYKEIYKRVVSKPTRLTEEYSQDLNKFIVGVPKRALSKPYRLMKYVDETRIALKKFKSHH